MQMLQDLLGKLQSIPREVLEHRFIDGVALAALALSLLCILISASMVASVFAPGKEFADPE